MPIKHDFSFFLFSLQLLLHLRCTTTSYIYIMGFCVIYVRHVRRTFSSLDGYLFAIHSTIIYYYVLSTTHEWFWCSFHWIFPSWFDISYFFCLYCWAMPFKRDILICFDVQDRPVFIWKLEMLKEEAILAHDTLKIYTVFFTRIQSKFRKTV